LLSSPPVSGAGGLGVKVDGRGNGVTSEAVGDQMIIDDEAAASYTTHLGAVAHA
jgi:hypothetical protein